MTKANAALFYASDGYRPADKGINGRRVAGESFLKGFLRHADVDEFVILAGPPCGAAQACPDFSAGAAPLRLGIVSGVNLSAGVVAGTITQGIDNWIVSVWRR